jgi:hypothetical protein
VDGDRVVLGRSGELRLVRGVGGARIAVEVHGEPGRLTDPWGNVVRLERVR